MKTTVTAKGQITIPKPVRDRLRLQPGDVVDFIVDADGAVQMRVVGESIKRLKGMVPKPKTPVSIAEMQSAIEEGG
ncbi:AbrB/MazE/SpoVT family DNA-binding domain-containing protein [candidate division KSB1 bacterium]|nr:AbrB/MazE/SpoVT family DNA-binding domain-containing protein [candidate division KSB1 bacterium]